VNSNRILDYLTVRVNGPVFLSGNDRIQQKLRVWSNLAIDLASLSVCRRLRVGCVILPSDLSQVVSIGYNGPAVGEPDTACLDAEGNCGCIHAEANAIAKLATPERDCLMVSTDSPCPHCAGLIINCRRIGGLFYLREYRDTSGLLRVQRAGILTVPWKNVLP